MVIRYFIQNTINLHRVGITSKFLLEDFLKLIEGILESVLVIGIYINFLGIPLQFQISHDYLLPLGLPQLHVLSIFIRVVLFCKISTVEKLVF